MILGWEVHNQGWIKDFSLRSPLCPFFPTAIHPPIFVRCCNQARDPRTAQEPPWPLNYSVVAHLGPSRGSSPSMTPFPARRDGVMRCPRKRQPEGMRRHGEERRLAEEYAACGVRGSSGTLPGPPRAGLTEVQGPRGAAMLRLREPGPETREVRRPDHREAGDIRTEETQPEGSRIRRQLGDRPERARG